ncbi:hypothetical protein BVRB_9g209840 [Beta vulgaris subsp. vulgaris]|nr:hypothetical protein BVRB_9g209840 [Beta vulgaris subsp. vulgaris]
MVAAAPSVNITGVLPSDMKKKRGSPRKYGPGGVVAAALLPMPISASIALSRDFSGWKQHRASLFRQ